MVTNTYLPQVGGVSRSIDWFSRAYLDKGHEVLIVAPTFDGEAPEMEDCVVRLPAIRHVNGSDFSVALPLPGLVSSRVEEFDPDIVHSHHPFLLGANALRLARKFCVPLVYTYHTMYEWYTHNLSAEWDRAEHFIINLAAGYANLCDCVIAPSESIADILRQRGVASRIEPIPTGVDVDRFARGDGAAFRRAIGIPADAFVVGHLGRLSPEKNLPFLSEGVARFLEKHPQARFLLIGEGPSKSRVREDFDRLGLAERLHDAGRLDGDDVIDAYHAMDAFAFASLSETQGMVIAEAMAAGTPVVALDAPGAREVVADGKNGRLAMEEDADLFAEGLEWVAERGDDEKEACRAACRHTAEEYRIDRCAQRVLEAYEEAISRDRVGEEVSDEWDRAIEQVRVEWDLLSNSFQAMLGALTKAESDLDLRRN